MEDAERIGNTREITRLTHILSGKSDKTIITPSKDLNGKPITSTEQLLKSWNEFLAKKFASPDADIDRPRETTVSPEDHLSDVELEECLKAMKSGRAPGWDGIPAEAYQQSPTAKSELFRIIHMIWESEFIPPEIVKGIFIMLYKKKNRDDFSNYRALCLLCHAYKLLSAVIAKRLHIDLEPILPDSQAGFRPARGTRDNICILKWTINMLLRESRQVVITFIDYSAAFDTESQIFLDEALSKASISPKLRRIVQSIFHVASGCVRIQAPDGTMKFSDQFDISRSILQGGIFSSVAFIAGLWRTFALHDPANAGVRVGKAPYDVEISGLEYADDAGLLNEDTQQASDRVTAISIGSRTDAAMSISIPKTKTMHIHHKIRVSATTEAEIATLKFKNKCGDCNRDFPTARGLAIHRARWCDGGRTVRSRKGSLAEKAVQLVKRKACEKELGQVLLEGQPIENVYAFEYLGSRVQCDGDDEADVKYRMDIAQSVFSSLSNLWSDHRLPLSMKLRLYRLAVCSTLTHACEAWNMTDKIQKKVNGFNSRCLHVITKEDYRTTATNPAFNLLLAIRRRRLRFLGHVLRMDTTRLVRRTFIAYVHNGTDIPAGSLMQDCDHMSIEDLTVIASDRKAWQRRVKALS